MKTEIELPPVIYRGRVIRVLSPNCVEVSLDLRFSVRIERSIILEGIDIQSIPPALREDAQYCLILLLAKKSVLVHTDDSGKDGYVKGRIFIAEDVRDPPIPLECPHRVDIPLLEVSSFYRWVGTKGYDPTYAAKLYGSNIPPRALARKQG